IPPVTILFAFGIGSTALSFDCMRLGNCIPGIVLLDMILGALPALIAAGLLAGLGVLISKLAISTGVWLGFRWKDRAPAAAGALLLIGLALLAILGGLAVQSVVSTGLLACLPITILIL